MTEEEKNNELLFELICKIIDEDGKDCSCLSSAISSALEKEISENICDLILARAKKGIDLPSKNAYFEHSSNLYKLTSKTLEKNMGKLLALVEDLVQLDCYSDYEKSAFILKEISYIFTFIDERNADICECIFNYIQTLTEIFIGEEKLEISTFICQFFSLQVNPHQEINFESFEKQVPLACSSYPNYKCLICDDKKVMCLGCSLTCHENHPVCYLNIPTELKFAKCMCSEISSNQCQFKNNFDNGKSSLFGKPKDLALMKPPSGLRNNPFGAPPEIFERMQLVGGSSSYGASSYISRPPRESQLDFPDRL